jgi:two-component system, NarL family, sensor histidine kinase DegS
MKKWISGYKSLLKNPHFWAILVITAFLLFFYSLWPWRERIFPLFIQDNFPWISALYELALFEIVTRVVGVLFFIPIIYASIRFSWLGALFTSMAAFAGVVPIVANWSIPAVISNLLILLLPFLWLSLTSVEFERRRKEKERLEERQREQKIYLSKINEAEEKERKRIAQDLHDETIQELMVIRRMAGDLSLINDPVAVKQQAASIAEICDRSAENLRRICLRLRPDVLDNLGLVSAIRWLADQVNQRSAVRISLNVTGEERRLEPNLEIILFRTVQEALSNVVRHSSATHAVIGLEFGGNSIRITVKDDGIGFDSRRQLDNFVMEGRLGLVGIKQRVESIGGVFQANSVPGEGTQLLIEAGYSSKF